MSLLINILLFFFMSVCNKQKSVELKHRESHFESHLRVALIQGGALMKRESSSKFLIGKQKIQPPKKKDALFKRAEVQIYDFIRCFH